MPVHRHQPAKTTQTPPSATDSDRNQTDCLDRRAALRLSALTAGGIAFAFSAPSTGWAAEKDNGDNKNAAPDRPTNGAPDGDATTDEGTTDDGGRAASGAAAVVVTGWGGCDLVRGAGGDRLTVEVAATGGEAVDISELDTFGTAYRVVGPALLRGPTGKYAVYRADGAFRYDSERRVLTLRADGTAGKLRVYGARFTPPKGEPFAPISLRRPAGEPFTVHASARGFRKPDHAAQRKYGPATLAALARLSAHFDGRMTPTGGWRISATIGPDGEDAQAIATLASGYRQLFALTGDPEYRRRAVRAFDWLVHNQQPAGGYGFPWRWGNDNGHKYVTDHFANGNDHPAGTPYAVNVINVGRMLLTGYEHFRDRRYLAAATRVRDYLLTSPSGGFQWLNAAKTRGSFPYCTLTPMLTNDDPRLIAHDDVLPKLRNSSVEFYNVDAFGARFFERYRLATGDSRLRRYERALLRNLRHRQDAAGTIAYSWTEPNHPDYYTYAVAAAFTTYGGDHPPYLEEGRRMLTWRDNAYHPSLIISEEEAVTPVGIDNTTTAVRYLDTTLKAQKPDGSWSGGKESRGDADKLNSLSMMLLQAGYSTDPKAKK